MASHLDNHHRRTVDKRSIANLRRMLDQAGLVPGGSGVVVDDDP